jgi:CelD/BcsL family acetyltransferase involved in cellulose biosynthesis
MAIAEQLVIEDRPKTGSTENLTVEVVRSWDKLMGFNREWDSLLAAMAAPSIFMTPEWLGPWWKAFGRDAELVGLVFLDQQRQVVAMAPLYRQRLGFFPFRSSRLRWLGAGSGDSDALDFIVKPGTEVRVAKAFLAWLAANKDWNICSLETLPKDSAVGRCLQESLQHSDWSVLSDESINYVIDLPATWQGYLQSLDPKFRPLLTRYPKRLHTRYQGVRISRYEEAAQLSPGLETLFDLHQMRWTGRGEAGAFSSAERRAFYAGMAEAFLSRGWLEFWRLELEGRTVATQFCFRYRDTVSLLQEGFDPKYAADKTGYALRAHVLETMIQSGARHYDFLGGGDSYKPKFGARAGSYLNLHFAGPSLLGRALLAKQRYSKRSRHWLKNHLPQRWLAARERPDAAG